MDAVDLYQRLLNAGTTVRVDDGQLLIGPADRLTDELRAAIKDGKPALLALLRGQGLDLDLQELIVAATCVCDMYGDGQQAREDMRADCLETPLHLRGDLLDHFNSSLEPQGFHPGFHRNGDVEVETMLVTSIKSTAEHAPRAPKNHVPGPRTDDATTIRHRLECTLGREVVAIG